ncbi:MAG TPA: ribosome silencing factor [Anaerolineae bacterium]|nr:ribosome silencing factor [Anaerolineae bacterium]HID83717.1 ribosome silencing factor [Anaerolineales bacterium]HIQ08658.1 ribosome silencing factor [Anaerolineaceae bacterium]
MAYTVVEALEEKKGEDILLLDLHEIAPFADYFVLCSGTSDRMLDSLANAALEKVRETHGLKGRVEGVARSGWILVDFGDVILHIFAPEVRDYYRLEELWAEGKVLLHLQ